MASIKNIFVKITNCRSKVRRHYRTSLEEKKTSYQIYYTLRETCHTPYRRDTRYKTIDMKGVDNLKVPNGQD